MIHQCGGFNLCDETNNEYMLPKIKQILITLERPGNDMAFRNEIINKFNECYKILLDFYADNSFYYQTIVRDQQPNFVSQSPIRKFHINFGALILLSFLSELEMNYLLYKGIDPINRGPINEKNPIIINKIQTPNNNNLKVYWSDEAINSRPGSVPDEINNDRKRIYKDTLTIDFVNNTNIIQTLDDFCAELNRVFNRFCNSLLDNLVVNLNNGNLQLNNNYTRFDLNIIFWYRMSPYNIYENWREELIRDVSRRSRLGIGSYNHTLEIILTQLKITCENFSYGNPEMKYYIDGFGFFSWMYLDQYSFRNDGIVHYGNCFTETLIEHFLLYGVHLKKNSINIAGFFQDIEDHHINRNFTKQYRLTDKSLFKKLSQLDARIRGDKWNYAGITHWGTKIYNDINVLDGVQIVINPSIRAIRIFDVGRHLFLPGANPQDRFLSYTPFSIFDDKWNYLRGLLYPNFDSMIEFIDYNRNLLKSRITNSILENISSIFTYIENIVQKKENNSISFPLNNIKQQLNDNINLNNINRLPQIILRANNRFFINSYNNNIMNRTSNLLGNTFNQTTFITEILPPDQNEERKKNIKDKFKNIVTKFIVFEFYKNLNTTYKFFKLINDIFNEGINHYISQKGLPANSINFIFKGGNILRLVVETYINELPGNARNRIKDIVNTNFKKSDADFQINIKDLTPDKTVAEMQIIEEEVTTLAYLLLYRIRNEILTNQKSYIDFYNLNFDSKKILLNKLLDTLNSVKRRNSAVDDPFELNNTNYNFTNITFDNVSLRNSPELIVRVADENKYEIFGTEPGKDTRKDFSISIEDSNPRRFHLNILPYLLLFNNNDISNNLHEKKLDQDIYKDRSDTNFYISVNKTIPDFILVRMKVSMKLEYSNGVENMFSIFPGEFIDVSIPRYTETTKYFLPETLKEYEIKGNNPFKFKSFSNDGFIKDLIETLDFNKNDGELPWDRPKYDIRLNRLFVLFFIDLMTKLSNDNCIMIINLLIQTFNDLIPIRDQYNINHNLNECINNIEQRFILFPTVHHNTKLVSFIEHYFTNSHNTSIFTKIRASADANIIDKFFIMIENIMTILDIFKSTLEKNHDYKINNISIINQSNLELNDLNGNNINTKYEKKYLVYDSKQMVSNPSLSTDFKSLYLKYKKKYLELKKKLNN